MSKITAKARKIDYLDLPEFLQDYAQKKYPNRKEFYRIPYNGIDETIFPNYFKSMGCNSFYHFGFYDIPKRDTNKKTNTAKTKGEKNVSR